MRIFLLSLALFTLGSADVPAWGNEARYEAFIASCENMDCGVLPVRYQFILLRWELTRNRDRFLPGQIIELTEILNHYTKEYIYE